MADKSYNSRALAGDKEYDDGQFQVDMKKKGINIPDDMLYKPEMNKYVLGEIKVRVEKDLLDKPNPDTGMNYTPEEAKMKAEADYMERLKMYSNLSGKDLTK